MDNVDRKMPTVNGIKLKLLIYNRILWVYVTTNGNVNQWIGSAS